MAEFHGTGADHSFLGIGKRIQHVAGLRGNDHLTGGTLRDSIRGGSGNDVLVGGDGASGELRYRAAGGSAMVQGDVNGGMVADFSLSPANVTALFASRPLNTPAEASPLRQVAPDSARSRRFR